MSASTMEGSDLSTATLGSDRESVAMDFACRALDLLATTVLVLLLSLIHI